MSTFLVAAADPTVRQQLRAVLTRTYPCHVIEAADGAAALARARQRSPRLVILDRDLPIFNGLRVCRTLKADAATRTIPVWILSGSSNPDMLVRAVAAGADGFFRKPVHVATLQARVREYAAEGDAAGAS